MPEWKCITSKNAMSYMCEIFYQDPAISFSVVHFYSEVRFIVKFTKKGTSSKLSAKKHTAE